VGFYVDFSPDFAPTAPYEARLYFDMDPALNNDVPSYIPFPNFFYSSAEIQESWNLGMPIVFGPGFDPNAHGEYSFALAVVNSTTGAELGRSAINVNVNATGARPVPDSGSTLALLGVALTGLGAFRNRFAR
jgi:hypothetical protein